eukprot:403376617
MESKTVQVLLYIGALLAIIAMERTYRDDLYAYSLVQIKKIQANTNPDMIEFMMLVSDFGVATLFIPLILTYLFSTKSRAYYYSVAVSINLYMMSIGKMGYHEPRPYMVDDDVQVYGCSKEFGQPSGHTFGSSTMILTVLFDVLKSYDHKQLNGCSRVLYSMLALSAILLIGFSRLHNGDHTIDQIILGWQFGIWQSFLMHFMIRDSLFQHIDRVTLQANSYNQSQKNSFKTIATCIFVAAMSSIIFTYQSVNDSFPVPMDWQIRLEAKCNVPVEYQMKFNTASFVQAGVFALFFSGYIGCISYGDSNLKDDMSTIAKTIITGLLSSIAAYPYLELAHLVDPYYGFFLCTTIPCLYFGFVMFYLADLIATKLGFNSAPPQSQISIDQKQIQDYKSQYFISKQSLLQNPQQQQYFESQKSDSTTITIEQGEPIVYVRQLSANNLV